MDFPFQTKVVGISDENDDGTSRQSIAATCRRGERLCLVRDRRNCHSRMAIMVLRANGQQLGFIREPVSAELAPIMDRAKVVEATITEITGGSSGGLLGGNIQVHEAGSDRRLDESSQSNGDDLSFLEGEAERIEARRVRRETRTFFGLLARSLRRLFSSRR